MRRLRRTHLLVAAVLVAAIAVGAWFAVGQARPVVVIDRAPVTGSHGVQLASRGYRRDTVTRDDPAPAVLLAHGLGGEQRDVEHIAEMLVRDGYVVRTWTSRGGKGSDGEVGVAGPDGEVADVQALVDALSRRADVLQDAPGDPRVAVIGISHGGGVALLSAARDARIDAVVPIFAWGSLRDALEPNAARATERGEAPGSGPREAGPGVLKLGWGAQLFAAGAGNERPKDACGNLEHDVCDAWSAAVDEGSFPLTSQGLLALRSPLEEAADIEAPTLFVQGQMDSLFDLDQVLPVARELQRVGTPTRVEWLRAGHDLEPSREGQAHLDAAIRRWLDRYLRKEDGVEVGPRFTVQLGAGRGYANTPELPPRSEDQVEPLEAVDGGERGFVRFTTPPRGLPAEATTLPGLGDVTRLAEGLRPPDGQRARFVGEPVPRGLEVVGAPGVRLRLRGSAPEATLFVRVLDIAPSGQELLPRGLVAPIRVSDVPALSARGVREVSVRLPSIAWRVAPGHRMAVEVASTDSAFDVGAAPAVWDVALGGDGALHLPIVRKPERSEETFEGGPSPTMLFAAAGAIALVALLVGLGAARIVRRGAARVQEPHLRDTPVSAQGLVKRYDRGRAAVDGVGFTVPAGSIVGLVGPNGAGKTTILRMLLGLVHPSDGAAWVFGQRVRPGAPMLRRVGAMVDGPGLLPHVSMRQHLVRYARATGRPSAPADIDAALERVDLLGVADRRVSTGSHGMRQRLGIAQALLGAPELVVLDEPTNGLDPAQIRHLRELIREVAADGRSVLLSSHLLGELELVCTHVVLLAEGGLLASGTLAEVVGDHPDLETAFLAATADHHGEGAHDA